LNTLESKHPMFLKNEVIAIYIIDLETNEILGANREAEKLSGYSKEELLNMRASDLADESNSENIRLFVKERETTGRISFEHIHKKKNGSLYLVEITCHILECYGRQLCQSFVRDLTNKEQPEPVRKLSARPQNTGVAVFSILDERITSWNKEAEKMFGYSEAEIIGASSGIIVPTERRAEYLKQREVIFSGQSVMNYDTERQGKDGTIFSANQSMFPIKDAKGKVVGSSLFVTNIENRKEEITLGAEEQQQRLLVETMNEGIMQVDNNHVILRLNKKFCDIMGYKEQELLGRSSMDVFNDPKDHESLRNKADDRQRGIKEKYEIRMKKKSGAWIWAYVSAAPLLNIGGKVVGSTAMLIDITQRKKAIQSLKEKNKELETFIFRASRDLQGPLNSALRLSSLTRNISDTAAKAYCQQIEACVGQMETLLHNLSSGSESEQGELKGG